MHIVDIIFFLLFLYIFFNENDLVKKQIALYLALFVLFVVFSEIIFEKQFSRKQEGFLDSISYVKWSIYYFSIFFYLFTIRIKKGLSFIVKPFGPPDGFDFLMSLPVIIFLLYYTYTKGYRLDGSFMDNAGIRSVWVDYIYVYVVSWIVSSRGSFLSLTVTMLIIASHMLAGERMRAFVYVMTILYVFYGLDEKRKLSSIFLLVGFFLATLIGTLRHGVVSDEYNVTHFGSVTISSLFLVDESFNFTFIQRINFFIGMVMANIVPSTFLNTEMSIRHYLVELHDIPGGGWLPVWLFAIAGNYGVIALAVFLAIIYRLLKRQRSDLALSNYDISKYAMLVIFVSTLPRWFMYTPYQVIKMPLYGFIACYLMLYLRNIMISGKIKQ